MPSFLAKPSRRAPPWSLASRSPASTWKSRRSPISPGRLGPRPGHRPAQAPRLPAHRGAIYFSNIVLGRVGLKNGDIEEANRRLPAAGNTTSTHQEGDGSEYPRGPGGAGARERRPGTAAPRRTAGRREPGPSARAGGGGGAAGAGGPRGRRRSSD